jgi:hypothetical protein
MKIIYMKRSGSVGLFKNIASTMILLLVAITTINGQQQRNEVPPLKDRLFFGGSFGLQFGTFTDIEVSPIVGLWVLPRIAVAAGPVFRYYKDPFDHTTIYGGTSYLQFLFIQDFNNLQGEYEALSLESAYFRNPATSGRFLLNTLLAGGGIRQPLGTKAALNFIFLWALNDSGYGIYGNPEIRISVTF